MDENEIEYFDVFIGDKLVQTDLTRQEVMNLFDIDYKEFRKLMLGKKFFGQYEVIDAPVVDKIISEELRDEWNMFVNRLRRRLLV